MFGNKKGKYGFLRLLKFILLLAAGIVVLSIGIVFFYSKTFL